MLSTVTQACHVFAKYLIAVLTGLYWRGSFGTTMEILCTKKCHSCPSRTYLAVSVEQVCTRQSKFTFDYAMAAS